MGRKFGSVNHLRAVTPAVAPKSALNFPARKGWDDLSVNSAVANQKTTYTGLPKKKSAKGKPYG